MTNQAHFHALASMPDARFVREPYEQLVRYITDILGLDLDVETNHLGAVYCVTLKVRDIPLAQAESESEFIAQDQAAYEALQYLNTDPEVIHTLINLALAPKMTN